MCVSMLCKTQIPANPIGNNAPGLKWNQIQTPEFRLIFPRNADSIGQRVAQVLYSVSRHEDPSIVKNSLKVPIILHTEAAVSNGFVTVGPFRSEFFPIQRQFGNATNYIDLLTIHEFRHVQQFSQATQGITMTVKKVLGSWAWGGMMATALPRWYFEGGAVLAETNLTKSGRGRLPSFNMEYHALFADDIVPSYELAAAGSLHQLIPDWYPLGYNLMAHGQEKFGVNIWSEVAQDAVRYKGLFFPFNRNLKKRTGMSVSDLHKSTFKQLKESYEAQISELELTETDLIGSPPDDIVTHYTMPKITGEDTILLKSAFDQLPHIIQIKEGEEIRICAIGRQLEGTQARFTTNGPLITWSQFAYDLRWRYKQYSDIYIYEKVSGVKRRVTSGERYSAPAISGDGQRIVAVKQNADLSQDLVVLSSLDGRVMQSFQLPFYGQIAYPVWHPTGNIIFIGTRNEGSQLCMLDIASGEINSLTELTPDQLSHPSVFSDFIYYSASYSGINNIYRIDYNSRIIQKVTEVAIGAFQPSISPDGSTLFYAELTAKGFRAKSTTLSDEVAKDIKLEKFSADTYKSVYDHPENSILDNLIDTNFQISKYRKTSGLLNPHSLLVEFNHPEVDLSLRSDNVFGTLSGRAGATYNYNENDWTYVVGFNYAEFFPIINASYVRSNRSAQLFNFSALSDTTAIFTAYGQRWKEDRFTAGLTLPFNLSGGNTNAGLNVSANYQTASINLESNFENENNFRDTLPAAAAVVNAYNLPISEGRINTLDFRFSGFAQLRQARLHLKPRFGFQFSMRYRNQIGKDLTGGDVWNLRSLLYLPGAVRTHSTYLTLDYQKENALDNYRYNDVFNYSRGYDLTLRRDRFFKFSFNYSLPLFYPDKAIGPLAFVKRIKANAFFDYSRLSLTTPPFQSGNNMHSTGLEIGFDFRALRLVEVDMGIRYSYLFNPELSGNQMRHQFDFFVISITQ